MGLVVIQTTGAMYGEDNYVVAQRYEFYFQVVKTIFHELQVQRLIKCFFTMRK